ncbi:exonuclease SbcC, partial [Streptomyces kunmingensis]|nr:exonuclease SbcC [Streptomyces kunmingensis]
TVMAVDGDKTSASAPARSAASPCAEELASEAEPGITVGTLEWARRHRPDAVTAVLRRLPAAPPGGGRVGELIRALDAALR